MSGIFGALGIGDTDRVLLSTLGQTAVYDAVNQVLAQHSADMAAAMSVFVERTTSDFKLRYKLAGGGKLQRRGGLAQSGAVKSYAGWDVGLPLEEFGAQIAADRIAFAYMTAQELARHVDTVILQDLNTVRFEILKALLNNTERTFIDPLHGSLLVEPLANADAVVYPPVIGSESEATDSHYLESGYAASAISDTNNPYATMVGELEEHGEMAGGAGNIAVFINNAQVAKTSSLTDFDEVADQFVRPGALSDVVTGLPTNLPGRVVGRVSGAWVVEWRWVPANYMIGLHLDGPAPLIRRIDPADTGLGDGLMLVAESDVYPFTASHYSHRFGVGVGNRLNGVVMELGTGGTYSIPSGYS